MLIYRLWSKTVKVSLRGMPKSVVIVLALFLLGIMTAFLSGRGESQQTKLVIHIKGEDLFAEVADTVAEHVRGLSGRKSLRENEGMLFVYQAPHQASFWMKNMGFAIDIIWLDAEKRIIGIEPRISPDTFPRLFYSPAPVQYVLEVQAGWAERHGATPGDQLVW